MQETAAGGGGEGQRGTIRAATRLKASVLLLFLHIKALKALAWHPPSEAPPTRRFASASAVKPAPVFTFQVLSYTGGQTHRYGDPGVSERFSFTGNPTQGDASIAVTELRGSDTATYQCKVKKAPGVDMRKVTLVVLGELPPLSELVLPVSFLTPSESGGGHAFSGGHAPDCVSLMQSDASRCSFPQFPPPHPSAGWKDRRRRAVPSPSAADARRAPPPSATPGAERPAAPCRPPPPRVTTKKKALFSSRALSGGRF